MVKLTPVWIEPVFDAADTEAKVPPSRLPSRAARTKLPSRLDLVGMTVAELEDGGAEYLATHSLRAWAACLRELQRRRDPLALNTVAKSVTGH